MIDKMFFKSLKSNIVAIFDELCFVKTLEQKFVEYPVFVL